MADLDIQNNGHFPPTDDLSTRSDTFKVIGVDGAANQGFYLAKWLRENAVQEKGDLTITGPGDWPAGATRRHVYRLAAPYTLNGVALAAGTRVVPNIGVAASTVGGSDAEWEPWGIADAAVEANFRGDNFADLTTLKASATDGDAVAQPGWFGYLAAGDAVEYNAKSGTWELSATGVKNPNRGDWDFTGQALPTKAATANRAGEDFQEGLDYVIASNPAPVTIAGVQGKQEIRAGEIVYVTVAGDPVAGELLNAGEGLQSGRPLDVSAVVYDGKMEASDQSLVNAIIDDSTNPSPHAEHVTPGFVDLGGGDWCLGVPEWYSEAAFPDLDTVPQRAALRFPNTSNKTDFKFVINHHDTRPNNITYLQARKNVAGDQILTLAFNFLLGNFNMVWWIFPADGDPNDPAIIDTGHFEGFDAPANGRWTHGAGFLAGRNEYTVELIGTDVIVTLETGQQQTFPFPVTGTWAGFLDDFTQPIEEFRLSKSTGQAAPEAVGPANASMNRYEYVRMVDREVTGEVTSDFFDHNDEVEETKVAIITFPLNDDEEVVSAPDPLKVLGKNSVALPQMPNTGLVTMVEVGPKATGSSSTPTTVINDRVTGGTSDALSAEQGKLTKQELDADITNLATHIANLVTSIRAAGVATDTNYPSEKAVRDQLDALAQSFLALPDTPNAFTGLALQMLRVNAAENAVEAVALAASLVAFDNTTATLPGAPATTQTAIEALKTLVDGLPTQVSVADFPSLPAPGGVPNASIYHVTDASGDPTVTAGWAKYQAIGGAWQKFLAEEDLVAVITLNNTQLAETVGAADYDNEVAGMVTVKGLDTWHASRIGTLAALLLGTDTVQKSWSPKDIADFVKSGAAWYDGSTGALDFHSLNLTNPARLIAFDTDATVANAPLAHTGGMGGFVTVTGDGTRAKAFAFISEHGSALGLGIWHMEMNGGVWGAWTRFSEDYWIETDGIVGTLGVPLGTKVVLAASKDIEFATLGRTSIEGIRIVPRDDWSNCNQPTTSDAGWTVQAIPAQGAEEIVVVPNYATQVWEVKKIPASTVGGTVFPGNTGAMTNGVENFYWADETPGVFPPALLGTEFSVALSEANAADSQAVKDAAAVRVTHYRWVDTGGGSPVALATLNEVNGVNDEFNFNFTGNGETFAFVPNQTGEYVLEAHLLNVSGGGTIALSIGTTNGGIEAHDGTPTGDRLSESKHAHYTEGINLTAGVTYYALQGWGGGTTTGRSYVKIRSKNTATLTDALTPEEVLANHINGVAGFESGTEHALKAGAFARPIDIGGIAGVTGSTTLLATANFAEILAVIGTVSHDGSKVPPMFVGGSGLSYRWIVNAAGDLILTWTGASGGGTQGSQMVLVYTK